MNLQGFLSKEELDAVRDRSDTIAVWQIFFNYALIVLGFAVFIAWPSPLTFLLGAMVQAGRILGLAVLNHEAAHHTLFRTRSLNRPVARWLLAGPSLTDFDAYRSGHMKHHQYAGTLKDPDISFVKGYPTSVPSMRRKFIRDLTGQTGMQDLKYLIRLSSLKTTAVFSLASHFYCAVSGNRFCLGLRALVDGFHLFLPRLHAHSRDG